MTYSMNYHYKDTLFRAIFGTEEHKDWLLSLYNALNGSDYENVDDLTLTTIEGVIYLTMKNDVSLLIDSQLTLIEQQSTYNPNMPLRGFLYFAELYQKYISKDSRSVLSTRLKKIPTPAYYVLYNGIKEMPDREELFLSSAFEKPCSVPGKFEWTATVLNINEGHNESLNKKCKTLYDYCRFVNRVKDNLSAGIERNTAIAEASDWAISQNLLDGYFKERKAEVMGMILHEFDQEKYERTVRSEGYEDGFNDGVAKGRENGARETKITAARNLLRMNVLSPEQIAQAQGLPLEEVVALKNESQL